MLPYQKTKGFLMFSRELKGNIGKERVNDLLITYNGWVTSKKYDKNNSKNKQQYNIL